MKVRDEADRVFKFIEDILYVLIGSFLIISIIPLIIYSIPEIVHSFSHASPLNAALHILDRMLLAMMIIEILYTVRVSLKSHSLCAEPFVIVGLIAAIRRILVISISSAYEPEKFTQHIIEVAVLGILVLTFVISVILLRKNKIDKDMHTTLT